MKKMSTYGFTLFNSALLASAFGCSTFHRNGHSADERSAHYAEDRQATMTGASAKERKAETRNNVVHRADHIHTLAISFAPGSSELNEDSKQRIRSFMDDLK